MMKFSYMKYEEEANKEYFQDSADFFFDKNDFQSEDQLEQCYLKQFNRLVNLLNLSLLQIHTEFPNKSICQANKCFILCRKVTSAMDKIIISMQGSKFRDENLRRVVDVGQFQYLDGQLKFKREIGIRVVKVKDRVLLNEEYSQFHPYILVHFFERDIQSKQPKRMQSKNQYEVQGNVNPNQEYDRIEIINQQFQKSGESSTYNLQLEQYNQQIYPNKQPDVEDTQQNIFPSFKQIKTEHYSINNCISNNDKSGSNLIQQKVHDNNLQSQSYLLEIQQQQAEIIKQLNQKVIELEKKNISVEIQNKNYEILLLQQREAQLKQIEDQLNKPVQEQEYQNQDMNKKTEINTNQNQQIKQKQEYIEVITID